MAAALQVLYDFCVSRGELREAAAAQLALARRLRDEDPKAVQAVHAALSAPLPCFLITCCVRE